jgi:hypothetical protein
LKKNKKITGQKSYVQLCEETGGCHLPDNKSHASGNSRGMAFTSIFYGKLKVFTMKTAICARLTYAAGQYIPLPHPPVIPSA